MLKVLLASALFAGLIAGLFAAGLQQAFLVPLIAEAELYETGTIIHFGGAEEAAHGAEATHEHTTAEEGDIFRNPDAGRLLRALRWRSKLRWCPGSVLLRTTDWDRHCR